MAHFPSAGQLLVEVKRNVNEELAADELDDHVPLVARMKTRKVLALQHKLSTIIPKSLHNAAVSEEAHATEECASGEVDVENRAESGMVGKGKPDSAMIVLLNYYKEAFENNKKFTVTKIEADLLSIEDEKKSLEDKVTALSQELSLEKDRVMQISADFASFKMRTEREHQSLVTSVNGEVLETLLPILNSFERVRAKNKINTKGEEKISRRYERIYQQFINVLCSMGVTVDPSSDKHHAADRGLVVQGQCADQMTSGNADVVFNPSNENCTNVRPDCPNAVTHCSSNTLGGLNNLQDGIESEGLHVEHVSIPFVGKIEGENNSYDRRLVNQEALADHKSIDSDKILANSTSAGNFSKDASIGSSVGVTQSPKTSECVINTLAEPGNLLDAQGIESWCLNEASLTEAVSPADNYITSLATNSFPLRVEAENSESGLLSPPVNHLCNSYEDLLQAEVKSEILEDHFADEIDYISLKKRTKMLVSSSIGGPSCSQYLNYLMNDVPGALEYDLIDPVDASDLRVCEHTVNGLEDGPVDSVEANHSNCRRKRKKASRNMGDMACESDAVGSDHVDQVKASRFTLRRKRKKTATDSVETALEEDAPGLLQVLVDEGIAVNEMKLYGAADDADELDISEDKDGFSELESVISKLFWQRSSFLKLASARNLKGGSKDKYCLACLISLVEQTRYLQQRKWPAEWGWCRDLQSFVFVFERHNRIVLERPEYGYATYFFELVDSLPINWQIKRLVTAMKLTSCSRTTLIENKALLVGEDVTEGEARVLEEYGWVRNSGLGTMLCYCDRVVHDRRSDNTSESDWRSRIGKLLTKGYDGGTVVLPNLPKKLEEFNHVQNQEIKLEV